LLCTVLATLACSAPVLAFSFCFSFGNNQHRYSSYNRYVPVYPPLPGMYDPAAPGLMPVPGAAYAYPSPPLQPYDNPMPAPSD
jgi:hypothetical protein